MRSKTPKITIMGSNWNCMDVLRGEGGAASEIKRKQPGLQKHPDLCVSCKSKISARF